MTTFREFLADMIREYFAIPRSTHEAQVVAATWQREPALPHNLAKLPGYHPGQYARTYHNALENAIQAATTPHVSRVPTVKPLIINPITPIPESVIIPQRENTTNPVERSLILWTSEDDEDATEMRPAIRLHKKTSITSDLPALEKLSWFVAMPTSEQSTGEQERINEDAFLL